MTPVITFDLPLFWKAMLIIVWEPTWRDLKAVVLRLGGLHIEMSFLGCVGHLMATTGLAQVLEVVYAENAVLSGKAVRTPHGSCSCQYNADMYIANAYNIPFPTNGDWRDEDAQAL